METKIILQLPEALPELQPPNQAGETMKYRIILGTGPSLAKQKPEIERLMREDKCVLYTINNTPADFKVRPQDAWIACDPTWHSHYGKQEHICRMYHWDKEICEKNGYEYIEGRWIDGLSTDPEYISYGHSSGWQALNLASHDAGPGDIILLCGYDMDYRPGEPRHYFDGLSNEEGEYPKPLRKWSLFNKGKNDGLLWDYKNIARQVEAGEVRPIFNCTIDSAMRWFTFWDIGRDMPW